MKNNKISKDELNRKLDLILKNENKILKNEKKLLQEDKTIENFNKEEIADEKADLNEEKVVFNEINAIENELKENNSPLIKVTKQDILKGFIGSFFGILAHFTFSEGKVVAETLNFYNATLLYVIAFFTINLILYYTGFRKIKKHLILKLVPYRAMVIYLVSIITIIFVYLIFGEIHLPMTFLHLYNLVAANIILAVIGAGTADLIGRSE